MTNKERQKKKKFKFWNYKNEKGEPFVGYIFWWAKIEPSHWATELRSRSKTFKIWASKPLSHDLSHQAMIQPNQAEINVPKPKSKPPSLWAEIRAIEPKYKPSRVESKYLSYFFVTKLKGYIKNYALSLRENVKESHIG